MALLCAIVLLMHGCAPGTDPALNSFRVSGTVQDSLSDRLMIGYTLTFGDTLTIDHESTVVDSNGAFEMVARKRPDTLRVRIITWFEHFERALSGSGDTTLTIRLQRRVPFVHEFSVSSTGVLQATVVHLRGAARVMQNNESWVAFYQPTVVQKTIMATEWTWQQVDSLTWHVTVATGLTGITGAMWNVSDGMYGAALTLCVTGNPQCTDNVY